MTVHHPSPSQAFRGLQQSVCWGGGGGSGGGGGGDGIGGSGGEDFPNSGEDSDDSGAADAAAAEAIADQADRDAAMVALHAGVEQEIKDSVKAYQLDVRDLEYNLTVEISKQGHCGAAIPPSLLSVSSWYPLIAVREG